MAFLIILGVILLTLRPDTPSPSVRDIPRWAILWQPTGLWGPPGWFTITAGQLAALIIATRDTHTAEL